MSNSLTSSKSAGIARSPLPRRHIPHTRIDHASNIEKHYELGSRLGKGSFGSVTEATRITDGTKWAVKAINKERAGSAHVKLLEHEVKIMKKVEHKNIIHLEEVFESGDKMLLVMELCLHGGLDEEVKRRGGFFPEKDALCIFFQLADAVRYMHENDITHRDLKLDNILLGNPTEEFPYFIKLADFGLSYTRGGSGSDYMMTQAVGTPIYMAPEVITNYGYSQQCDIWSIGIVLHMLLSGKAPFLANTEEELYELIKRGELNFATTRWATISPAAKQLLEGMLKVDPAHRLTSKEVVCQPWLKGETEVSSVAPMNVLEMMKLCRLEQTLSSENGLDDGTLSYHSDLNNNSNASLDLEDGVLRVVESKKSETKTKLLSPTRSPRRSPSSPNNSTPKIPCSPVRRSPSSPNNTTNTKGAVSPVPKISGVPSYMQPTKSSASSKTSNIKPSKKK